MRRTPEAAPITEEMVEAAMAERRTRVYVAGPISQGDFDANIRSGLEAGRRLVDLGFSPFIPHFDSYLPRREELTWRDFLACDLAWVRTSQAILRLPGPSKGADLECRVARRHGIPIFHSVEDLVAWDEGLASKRRRRQK
jgi:hypothetical protein